MKPKTPTEATVAIFPENAVKASVPRATSALPKEARPCHDARGNGRQLSTLRSPSRAITLYYWLMIFLGISGPRGEGGW